MNKIMTFLMIFMLTLSVIELSDDYFNDPNKIFHCEKRLDLCTPITKSVCASDGRIYINPCVACQNSNVATYSNNKENCEGGSNTFSEISCEKDVDCVLDGDNCRAVNKNHYINKSSICTQEICGTFCNKNGICEMTFCQNP